LLPAEDSDYGEFAKWIVDGSGEIALPFGLSMPRPGFLKYMNPSSGYDSSPALALATRREESRHIPLSEAFV